MKKILKNLLCSFLLSIFVVLPCIGLLPGTTALAGTQTFVVPNEAKPSPENFINGSFQTPLTNYVRPSDKASFGFFPMDQVPGWQTVPIDYSKYGNDPDAYMIEIQKVDPTGRAGGTYTFATSQADGDQYAELNANYPGRLYQVLTTVPGSRLYWQFAHRAIGNSATKYDQLNFYLRPSGTPTAAPDGTQLIQSARDNGAQWYYYRGFYTVPAGQTSTEFTFASVSSWTGLSEHGNFLDDISFKTGSKLIAKKSIATSSADDATALQGEIVTITTAVTNWGETDADRCVYRDVLSDGLDYIAGSAKINGAAAGSLATFDSSTDILRVNFGTGATAGTANTNGGVLGGSISMGNTSGEGATATITYQARVTGNVGYVVKSQSSMTYNDKNYESYNASDLTSYSSVSGKTVSSSDETTYVNRFTVVDRSLSGRVWYDTDSDGMIDSGETRVSGLTVGMYLNTDTAYTTPAKDANDTPLTTTTDASGNYSFHIISGGTYKIVVTTPAGHIVTVKTAATDNDATASGAKSIISGIAMTGLLSPTNTTNIVNNMDIGFANMHSVSGRIWTDTDMDGMIDTGESLIAGVTVGVYASTDTMYTTPVNDISGNPLTMTSSTGGYAFSNIPDGTYKIAAAVPGGNIVTVKTDTTDNDAVASGTKAVINGIDLTDAVSVTNMDIGFTAQRTISGRVWYDADADGMIDAAETKVSGLTVGVYQNTDNLYTTPVKDIYGSALTATTDASGNYSFSAVPSGTYKIVTTKPNDYLVTLKTASTDNDAVSEAIYAVISGININSPTSVSNMDFGFTVSRVISGWAWYDADTDGILDSSEAKAPGLTVGMYLNSDTTYTTPVNDIYGNPLIKTTDTLIKGVYGFTNIPAGIYKIVMTTPSGYIVTVKTASTDNKAVPSGTKAVISGVDLTTSTYITDLDIGFTVQRTISGRAWYDLDSDGAIDTGETMTSGLTVGLYASNDTTYTTPVKDIYGTPLTTTTNSSGVYSFSAIPAGTYKAVATTPNGYSVTVLANDNDAVASGTKAIISGIDLISPANVINKDFGFINTYSITLSKIVKGTLADPHKNFTFTITLTGVTDPLPYTGTSAIAGISPPANGTITSGGTITLKHGQSITVSGVPAGTAYSITESNASGYTQAVTNNNASGKLAGDINVQFVNTKNEVPPTGIFTDIIPYLMMVILVAGIIALLMAIRRKTVSYEKELKKSEALYASGRRGYRGL